MAVAIAAVVVTYLYERVRACRRVDRRDAHWDCWAPEPNRHGCHCRQYDPSHQLFLDTTKILRINSPRTEVEDFDLNQKHNCRGARHAQAAGTLVVFYDMVKPVHTPMIRPARAYE